MIKEDFYATRTDDGRYEITANIQGEHRLYWSSYPNGFCDDNELGSFSQSTVVNDPLKGRRCYFHIMTGSHYSVCATRKLKLGSLQNFRELGGYNTADGLSFVKYGCFFRSDRLCDMGENGAAALKSLGIKRVCDFRVQSEIDGHEDPELPDIERLNLCPIPGDHFVFNYTLKELIEGAGKQAILDTQSALNEEYRRMPFGSSAYREMFRGIIDGRTPMLFHCTAGKDRTGIAALLILLALGVPSETVVEDYMLTRTARSELIDDMLAKYREYTRGDAQIENALTTFFSVQESAIRGTLEAIENAYGDDLGSFFRHELYCSADELQTLRARYLSRH